MDYHNELNCVSQEENSSSAILTLKENSIDDESLSAARAEELRRLHANEFLPQGFYFDEEDWLTFQKELDNDKTTAPVRICSRLEVVARTRDQIGENHGRLLQFLDPDKVIHQWAMPMELLAGDGAVYRQELLSKGLLIAPGKQARQLLTTYIQISYPFNTVRCSDTTGWNKERTAFVFQKETIGSVGKEPLILQMSLNMPITQTASGDLEQWQKIAALCIGNSRLILAVSIAFAPPLLSILNAENGGVHFRGGSSSGKTTCLRVAASVWGGNEYVQQWRATSNGLEGTASNHNDCLLCLDEIGQMDPSEVGKVAYMLANGTGKTRADKLGNSRQQKQWRLLFLSSGEISLSDHMFEGKQRVRAGQEVRVLDIPADGHKYGCFENLHGFEQGKTFAEHLGELCKLYHGIPGREFVRCLLPIQEEIAQKAKILTEELFRKYVPVNASSQVHRVFNRFALIAVAGELATTFGITGWPEGKAIEAAINCFNDWLRARGNLGSGEEQKILSQVRHFFEQHGDSRFTSWHEVEEDVGQFKTIMRVGYRKKCNGGEEFFVFPESFKKDIASGFDPELVAQICLKHKLLIPDPKGGATRSERLPGAINNSRMYRFTSKVLAGESEVVI